MLRMGKRMTFAERVKDAWQCETCRRYRQGAVLIAALLALSFWLG